MTKYPGLLIFIGITLLFLGVILPFLMVIHVVDASFPLLFISSGSSTLGLALGMVGLTRLPYRKKRK